MKRIRMRLTRRRLLAMSIDVGIVVAAYYVALSFRFAGRIPDAYSWRGREYLLFAGCAVAVHLMANLSLHVYTIVNRYVGLPQALHLAQAGATATGALLVFVLAWPSRQHLLPLSVVLLGGIMATVSMIGVRFYGRVFHERSLSNVEATRRLLLVGAGQAAELIIRETHRNPQLRTRVVGMVDDDPRLQGMRLHNHPVLGTVEDLAALAVEHEVSEILIAIPSASSDEMARIHRLARSTDVPIKTLPTLGELVDGQPQLCDARALSIEDLLGRPRVVTDLGAIASYLQGRRILVTGAGGSIGAELCRQIATFEPGSLLLVDRDESSLYHLHEDLRMREVADYTLAPTSILQQAKMESLFREFRPDVVFHAAAFKHVPLMELHPDEAVLNNVKGTQIVADLAGRFGVKRFVNISTDKAVDPLNVMGATKRAGEMLVRSLAARYPTTRFCSVRFGNVLGSRGSVVPIFRQQIANGGPVTITHPEMTRYFMMIEEAVLLVLQAAALTGADSAPDGTGDYGAFVLEMGEPVRITDLAYQMITLLNPDPGAGIGVEFTGVRPGEKVHEALFSRDERAVPTSHSMIRLALPAQGFGSDLPADFDATLDALIQVASRHAGPQEVIPALMNCVPTYEPFDWELVGSFPGVRAAKVAALRPRPVPDAAAPSRAAGTAPAGVPLTVQPGVATSAA